MQNFKVLCFDFGSYEETMQVYLKVSDEQCASKVVQLFEQWLIEKGKQKLEENRERMKKHNKRLEKLLDSFDYVTIQEIITDVDDFEKFLKDKANELPCQVELIRPDFLCYIDWWGKIDNQGLKDFHNDPYKLKLFK